MFNFEIRFIFIEEQYNGMLINDNPHPYCFLMSVYNTNKDKLYSTGERIYTWDRNRFSWYVISVTGGGQRYQLNENGYKYCYIGF